MVSLASFYADRIRSVLRTGRFDSLRRPRWRGLREPLAGHCYVASEALFHLLGGATAGLKPCFVRHERQPHWYLECSDGAILDVTVVQFSRRPDYWYRGRGCGFLTKRPSKRARILMKAVLS